MTTENQEIEIELDDKNAAISHVMAEVKGITVEELIRQCLDEAMQTGYFDQAENVTTDDPLV